MLNVYCHQLSFKPAYNTDYKTNDKLNIEIQLIVSSLFGLDVKHFYPASRAKSTDKQFIQYLTFRGEIDLEFRQNKEGLKKLYSIVTHGQFWERLGDQFNYAKMIKTATKLGLSIRDIHFKTRLPASLVTFTQIDDLFLHKHYVSSARIHHDRDTAASWYVGDRGKGFRLSFYDAHAMHEDAETGSTDVELQINSPSNAQIFLDEINVLGGLDKAFFARLTRSIQFKNPDSTDSNMTRRPFAEFWKDILSRYPRVKIPKQQKATEDSFSKLQRQVSLYKGKMYTNLLKATPHVHMEALEQFLLENDLAETLLHRLLERKQADLAMDSF